MSSKVKDLVQYKINTFLIAAQQAEKAGNKEVAFNCFTSASRWKEHGDRIAWNIKENGELLLNIDDNYKLPTNRTIINMAFGPSLRHTIEQIKQIKASHSNIFITGSDRGYYYYRNNYIRPNVVYSIDPSIDYKYLGGYRTTDQVLIASIQTNSLFVREWVRKGGKVKFVIPIDPITGFEKDLELFGRDVEPTMAMPTVGVFSLMYNHVILEPKNQFLCGHDYSFKSYYYPDEKAHLGHYNKAEKLKSGRYLTQQFKIDHMLAASMIQKFKMKIVDCSQNQLLTNKGDLGNYFRCKLLT